VNDEPWLKRLVLGPFRRRKIRRHLMDKPEEDLPAAIVAYARDHQLPVGTVRDYALKYIAREQGGEPWLKSYFRTRRQILLRRFDVQETEALDRWCKANASTLRAYADLQRAAHEADTVPVKLIRQDRADERAEELSESQHRTQMIEERVKRVRLRQEGKQAAVPPTAQSGVQKPDPLERFERAVSAQFSGLRGKENAAATKIEVVQLTAEVHIKLAEAKGDQELAARLRQVRDDLIADLRTGESEL